MVESEHEWFPKSDEAKWTALTTWRSQKSHGLQEVVRTMVGHAPMLKGNPTLKEGVFQAVLRMNSEDATVVHYVRLG